MTIFFIVYVRPEMEKSVATNFVQEVVSDLSHDIKRMLESHPKVAS
jgi:hypothetical protein